MFTRRNTSIKITVYALILILFYLLQSVPALHLRFMGNAPELMLLLTVCVAFNESEDFSAFFGLVAGILNDIVTDSTVGISALIFMFAAFFIAVLLKTLLRSFFLTYVSLTLILLVIYLIIKYLLALMLGGSIPFGTALMQVMLPKFLFTSVLSYPSYFFINFVYRMFEQGGEGE